MGRSTASTGPSPDSCGRRGAAPRAVSVVVLVGSLLIAACDGREAQTDYPASPAAARGFDTFAETCAGIPARMVWDHLEYAAESASASMSEADRAGACTWYFWSGGDPLTSDGPPENARGNPRFWRMAEVRTAKTAEETGLRIGVNLLSFIDTRRRGKRFAELGVINDPGCRQAREPDPFGLWLDTCEDPYSSGVMGLRLFPNPAFEPERWDPRRYLASDRSAEDAAIEPPYLVGMTCGACHIAFSPTHPPSDPERPEWKNLAPALGNQYLREGELFKGGLTEEDFLYWVYDTQQPGTSDTSRISVDWINNPNAINSIFSILSDRPRHTETMNDGTEKAVPHVLKDGSDSIGPGGAALRVYVNIGTCPDYRMSVEDAFTGLAPQQTFRLDEARKHCLDWRLTADRMDDVAGFLDRVKRYPLAKAPGGEAHLTASEEQLRLGRRVFGGHCARCHSSKLPPGFRHGGPEKHTAAAREAWIELALRDDFLDDNFLSDDRRYPLVSDDPRFAIGTNAARALATNALAGHVWARFSSRTYKELPSPGTLALSNPFDETDDIEHEIPAGGRGYYRTPSLINVWATAPLLHNNMLGNFTGDPSVAGRMEAFEDAMEKLLWPEKRLHARSIKTTGRDTVLKLRSLELTIPENTPVNLFANIDLREVLRRSDLHARLGQLSEAAADGRGDGEALRALMPELLALNQAPDFIEDHGHDSHYGELTDSEKRALIALLKTF